MGSVVNQVDYAYGLIIREKIGMILFVLDLRAYFSLNNKDED